MTNFQRRVYMSYKMDGKDAEAEAYLKQCEEAVKAKPGMTEAEANAKAETHVFCDMDFRDIEDECRRRRIPLSMQRVVMETALITAFTKEYMQGGAAQ